MVAISLLSIPICIPSNSYAAQGGGAVLQNLEKSGPAPKIIEQQMPTIEPEMKKPAKMEVAGPKKIPVKKFRIEGVTIFSEKELMAILAQGEGKELTLEEIKSLADLITAKYRDAGYLTVNAMVPAQKIVDGLVLIKIVIGRVGNITVVGNKSYSTSFIESYLATVRKDPALKEDKLEKALLILSDYPSLTVKASLKAGKEPGTSDLLAEVTDRFPVSGSLSYDNYGVKTTSRNRGVASLDLGNLATSGDALSLRGIIGLDTLDFNKLSYGRAEYVVPVGGTGTKYGAYYTNTVYAAGENLAPLELKGKAQVFGLFVSHPIIKKRDESLSVRIGGEYSSVKDDIIGSSLHRDEIRKLNFAASYDMTDRYLGKNFFGVSYSRGLGTLFGGSGKSATGTSRPEADDSFDKINIDAMRVQKLPGYNHIIFRGGVQISDQPLLLAEQYILGGEGTVRGFSPSKVNGDSGFFVSAELVSSPLFPEKSFFGHKVGDAINFALFGDYGATYKSKLQLGENSTDYLGSIGTGFRIYLGKYFSGKLDWAVPVIGGSTDLNSSVVSVQATTYF